MSHEDLPRSTRSPEEIFANVSMRVPAPKKGYGSTHVRKDSRPMLLLPVSRPSAGQGPVTTARAASGKDAFIVKK